MESEFQMTDLNLTISILALCISYINILIKYQIFRSNRKCLILCWLLRYRYRYIMNENKNVKNIKIGKCIL